MKKQAVSIFIHVTVFSKVLNTLVISRLFGKKAGHTPCFFQWNSWKLWSLVFNSSYLWYLPFVNLQKNLEKMKKAFCFDYFSMSRSESKFFHVWFEFFPSYRSRKKETEEKFFEAEAIGQGREMFPRFPFFYWGNLGKTQIIRGRILIQAVTWKTNQNRMIFSRFFRKFTKGKYYKLL